MIAVALAVLLWSTSFGISGGVLETTSPSVLSDGRFLIGLIILIPLTVRRPGFAQTLRRPRTMLLGLLGVALYYSLTNISLEFTSAGTVALTNAALPALTAVLGLVLLRERLTFRTTVGLVLATVGVGIVASSGLTLDLGVLLSLIGLASYGLYTVLLRRELVVAAMNRQESSRPAATDVEPVVLATATAVWGTVIMLPWLAFEVLSGDASLPNGLVAWSGLAILGIVVTAPAIVLFNYGAERLPAAVMGIITAAIPALGYIFALLLGEPFDIGSALGGGVALIGVLIASTFKPEMNPCPSRPAFLDSDDVTGDPSFHRSHVFAVSE